MALVTLTLVYIDENLSLKSVPRGLAVFQSAQLLGPAIGFIAGGALLNQWVDGNDRIQSFSEDEKSYTDFGDLLKPESDLWVGNWWGLFIVGAVLGVLVGLMIC